MPGQDLPRHEGWNSGSVGQIENLLVQLGLG